MVAADNAEKPRASRPASLVQVYTAGLQWETEPMVIAWAPTRGAATAAPLHRLPLECPVEELPGDHRSLWTALWQAACLLRPEVSPAQWRPWVRRLVRIDGALVCVDTKAGAPTQHEPTQDPRTALDVRMAEWVHRLLLPAPQMGDSFRPTISVLESTELDLDAMELCRRQGGVVLIAWQWVYPAKRGDGR